MSRSKKLTIGMATYEDYDGVYFSLQAIRIYHSEILDQIEFIILDNAPAGAAGKAVAELRNHIPNLTYRTFTDYNSTASRDWLFRWAQTDWVLCMDAHVFLLPGALQGLLNYINTYSNSSDLLQGPLIYDDLIHFSTHFEPRWQQGMYGVWATDQRAADPQTEPFEIPMQGLGLFACRKAAWPGFNPHFRGFGGEEGYIHEKIRQAGGRTLCLPFLRWVHRFNRPLGAPYPNRWEDRMQNYLLGWQEVGWNTRDLIQHFNEILGESGSALWQEVYQKVRHPVLFFSAVYWLEPSTESTTTLQALDQIGLKSWLRRRVLEANEHTVIKQIVAEAELAQFSAILIFIGHFQLPSDFMDSLNTQIEYLQKNPQWTMANWSDYLSPITSQKPRLLAIPASAYAKLQTNMADK